MTLGNKREKANIAIAILGKVIVYIALQIIFQFNKQL